MGAAGLYPSVAVGASANYNRIYPQDEDRADYLSQQNRSEEARRQLGYLLAGKGGETWQLTDTIPTIDEHFDPVELHRIAQSDNSSLRNQYVSIRLREEETRIARSDYYPSLSVGAGASYAYNRTSGVSTHQIQPYVSAKLSFTLFNGSQRRRAVRIAEINRQAEEITLDEMRLSVNYDVDRQHSDYLLCRELVSLRRSMPWRSCAACLSPNGSHTFRAEPRIRTCC